MPDAAPIAGLPSGAIEHACGWRSPDWSDFELRLVLDFKPFTVKLKDRTATIGPVFSWKRSRKVIVIKGRGSIGLTTEARHWVEAAAKQLRDQWSRGPGEPIPAGIEINAAIVSYLPDKRRIDASNLYQGVEDAMQSCGAQCAKKTAKNPRWRCKRHAAVLRDDHQIRTHNESDRRLDRARSRVEVTLTPYAPGKAKAHPVQTDLEF